jgi:hypothetical protein
MSSPAEVSRGTPTLSEEFKVSEDGCVDETYAEITQIVAGGGSEATRSMAVGRADPAGIPCLPRRRLLGDSQRGR